MAFGLEARLPCRQNLGEKHSYAARAPGLVVGAEVEVTGALSQRGINPIHIKIEPATPFAGRVRRLSIEGYVGKRNRNLVVGGVAIARVKEGVHIAAGDRVVVRGVLNERQRLMPTVVRPSTIRRQRGSEPGRTKSPALQRQHIFRQPRHPLHERSRIRSELKIKHQGGAKPVGIKPLSLQSPHFFRQPSYDRPRFGPEFRNNFAAPRGMRRH